MERTKYGESSPSTHYLPPGVKLTSLGSRIFAILIDFILFLFLLLLLDAGIWNRYGDLISFLGFFSFISVMTNPLYFAFFLAFSLFFEFSSIFFFFGLFGFFYWFFLEGINDGQTLGKMVVGIRVAKIDKTSGAISSCTVRASVVRNLARIIDGLPFYYIVGLMSIADSGLNQRIRDLFAETIVIKA